MLNLARLAFASAAIAAMTYQFASLNARSGYIAWLAYPLAWFVYTLVRGAQVDWYPYPFVDVSELGYGGVLARSVVLAGGFAVAGAALLWLANRRALR